MAELAGQISKFENRIPFSCIQTYSVKSVNVQILHTVVVVWDENFVEKDHFTFNGTGPAGQFRQIESALRKLSF